MSTRAVVLRPVLPCVLCVCQGAVLVLDFNIEFKTASKVLEACRKEHPDGSFCLIYKDEDGNKVGFLAEVTAAGQAAGLDAKAWIGKAVDAVGAGKSGGNAKKAQGGVPGVEHMQVLVQEANKYLQ